MYYGHYFIGQLSIATSCRPVQRFHVTHSADRPNARRQMANEICQIKEGPIATETVSVCPSSELVGLYLISDSVSSSDYIVSNVRIVEDVVGRGRAVQRSGVTEEEELRRGSLSLVWDVIPRVCPHAKHECKPVDTMQGDEW